jgi:hypothetical protein
MNALTGKSLTWTFVNGPMAGTTFGHTFHDDGSVTWRILDGQYKGASAREKACGAVKINDKTLAVSYLAASGHTLTVVLSLDDGSAVAFASNEKSWELLNGTFAMSQ